MTEELIFHFEKVSLPFLCIFLSGPLCLFADGKTIYRTESVSAMFILAVKAWSDNISNLRKDQVCVHTRCM